MARSLRAVAVCAALVAGTGAPAQAHSPRDEPSEDKPSPPVDPSRGEEEWFSLHYQMTAATQYHPAFAAKYSSPPPPMGNSLRPSVAEGTNTWRRTPGGTAWPRSIRPLR